MKALIIPVFLCLAVGIYLIISELVHMPTLANTRAVLKLTQEKKLHGIKAIEARLSADLAKHIHLNAYRRRTMTATLKYAGIDTTPEAYYAQAIVKAVFRFLPGILCAFIFPVTIAIFALWALKGYFDGTHEAQKVVGEKRTRIDAELPRFTETVAQELESSRDVLSILEGYLPSAGVLFRDELKITVAEMKSGSQEQALSHLAGRVGSANLNQVVRGLLVVLRGGDGVLCFTMLSHDFQHLESQALEKEAIKRPGQLKKYSWLMFACFAAAYIYVIVVQVLSTTNGMWGDPVELLKSRKGEMMITVCILLMVVMSILAFMLKLYPVFLHKQEMDTYASEVCRVAEISGRVGDETAAKETNLNRTLHFTPDVVWNVTGKVQLNGSIEVTCTMKDNIGLWGGFGSFPVTIRGHAIGQSEVYWK